ncbi:MAG: CBS domain-containing protein [Deltaproteobacteria bacterium]|nr:CBS domain-containing protein [Deltaproteobacteria bacterium]
MLTVRDLMSTSLFTLQKYDSIKSAKSIMKMARIRHIPIVDEKSRFVGLITHRDILSATVSKLAGIDRKTQDELDAGIPAGGIMRKDAITVPPEMNLKEAAQILYRNKYGCLPVVEDGKLVGILTEADFLTLVISLLDAIEASPEIGSHRPPTGL